MDKIHISLTDEELASINGGQIIEKEIMFTDRRILMCLGAGSDGEENEQSSDGKNEPGHNEDILK